MKQILFLSIFLVGLCAGIPANSSLLCKPPPPPSSDGEKFVEGIDSTIDEGMASLLGIIVNEQCRSSHGNRSRYSNLGQRITRLGRTAYSLCTKYNQACGLFDKTFCKDNDIKGYPPNYFSPRSDENITTWIAYLTAVKFYIAYPKLVRSVVERETCSSENLDVMTALLESEKRLTSLVRDLYCIVRETVRRKHSYLEELRYSGGNDSDGSGSGFSDYFKGFHQLLPGREDQGLAVSIIASLSEVLNGIPKQLFEQR